MTVYRITLQKWASSLVASGRAARWNSNGFFVIYASGTRALACLENIVHRRSIGNDDLFSVTVIDIPSYVAIPEIDRAALPSDWRSFTSYASCQEMGNQWVRSGASAVLRIPSAIIAEENNYLLNPAHPDFRKISIVRSEGFAFDERLRKTGV
jgi:RES domain-containing protein